MVVVTSAIESNAAVVEDYSKDTLGRYEMIVTGHGSKPSPATFTDYFLTESSHRAKKSSQFHCFHCIVVLK
jgi:predicted secreted protein